MDNNFTLILTSLFTAGSLGFVNYFILERIGILIFKRSNEQDKRHFLFFFSLLNYIIYLIVYLIFQTKFANSEELFIITISMILTLFITICLSLYVFPSLANKFTRFLNGFREKTKLSMLDHKSPRSMVFDNQKKQSVFIFDFNRELISSGYLDSYSNESDYYEITLVPFDKKPDLYNYNKVNDFSESKDGQEKDIIKLLDFEKQIQYFVITDID